MYFIIWNTKSIRNKFSYRIDFFKVSFYRLKAKGDNSSRKGKGYFLGHIHFLHIDT